MHDGTHDGMHDATHDKGPARETVRAYVALGANLGDRRASLMHALEALGALGRVPARSSLWESPPVGPFTGEPGPDYLNAAAALDTALPAEALLDGLLSIERAMGRERAARNAPRTIDLDLLLYGDAVIGGDRLQVPHPRMHERAFVLEPLAEIAGDTLHPVLQCSIATLRDRIRARGPGPRRVA
jgi:2-amino-4-hydroxy-6-hydroxymethyldihydropteridine diphosphokinase